ncbi:MAG: hypothetical protein L3J07_00355 [Candidatus Magasanikbacteria bacterium]|nr:hypothetical protein [Candidatus Magasanikbacteria bacterium]
MRNKKLVKKATAVFYIMIAVVFLFSIFSFSGTTEVYAQGDTFGLESVDSVTELATQDIRITIAKIIRVFLGLLGIIALSIIIYGGFTIMTSAGNEEKVATGKKILVNAVIGLVIILSSFAITQFVLSSLQKATGGLAGLGGTARAPGIQVFAGSGSFGKIISDHFPDRDQRDVSRNTKISVTFNESIDPSSIAIDSNGNGVFGDCVTPDLAVFDWNTQCDVLNKDAVKIYSNDDADSLIDSAVIVTETDGNILTFTIKPLELLGNPNENVWYTVDLTEKILKIDTGTSVFDNDRDGHYFWEFEVGTLLDFDPPKVTSVFPTMNLDVSRNTILQINFNEPMDPTSLQGISGSGFTNIIFGDTAVSGEWRITNGYKTVEFVSTEACGQNSCGDVMYCLPVECPDTDLNCTVPYEVLVRTAELISEKNSEAIPFTGVMDISGNALDGNADGVSDGKPVIENPIILDISEKVPDNYFWEFGVINEIDRTSPYIENIFPGIDQENVRGSEPIEVGFSMIMWSSSLKQAEIQEYPANEGGMADIWFNIGSKVVADSNGIQKTNMIIKHREFGPNGLPLHYFSSVSSDIKSINQNCVYPGKGPSGDKNTSPTCVYKEDKDGNVVEDSNCTPVNLQADTDTGCVQTADPEGLTQPNLDDCISFLESVSQID